MEGYDREWNGTLREERKPSSIQSVHVHPQLAWLDIVCSHNPE